MSDLPAVTLVKGDDPALVAEAARAVIAELVGEQDATMAVEAIGGGEELDAGAVVDACLTPPFFTDRRVVVVRDAGRLDADGAARLVEYLAAPLETTALVLVAGGGAVNVKLQNAAKKVGRVVDASVPNQARARSGWLADRLRQAPVRLDGAAVSLVADRLGEDLGRLPALLDVLVSTYGEGARLGADDVEPFVGHEGGTTPWALTDAIDAGDYGQALRVLRRMLGPGDRHPLVVLATLHRHYSAMLRLDGAGVTSDAQAGELLGVKPFMAGKALRQLNKLGSAKVARAVTLLAEADLDLRGAKTWPEELVLDVLVARLCQLGRR